MNKQAADIAATLVKKGHELFEKNMFEEALVMMRRVANFAPNQEIETNVAACLVEMGKYEEAHQILSKVVKAAPMFSQAVFNLARLYSLTNRWEESETLFDRLLEMDPNNHKARAERGFMFLRKGEWAKGFVDYEARVNVWTDRYGKFPIPEWNGEDINGKRLYVQIEQGIGDTILFSRYLKLIKDKYPDCTIIFCLDPRLQDFFWYFTEICEFVPPGIPFDCIRADYGIRLCSLLRIFGTTLETIPKDPGYFVKRIMKDREKRRPTLPEPSFPNTMKVGICWTGNPNMVDNDKRSLPFKNVMELAVEHNIQLYSIQTGYGVDKLDKHEAKTVICDMSPSITYERGLTALGQVITELDAVVAMCSLNSQIAGVLGVPTFLLLHKENYWTWGLEGNQTAWHPSHYLIRQKKHGEWKEVFDETVMRLQLLKGALQESKAAD